MGTRADFYIGIGAGAEWLGSIAWDGYPEGIDELILHAKSEKGYLLALDEFFKARDDVTLPENGWPWPWEDSHTTDYAYCFVGQTVQAYRLGKGPFDPTDEPEELDDNIIGVFPDMSNLQNVAFGPRSGLIVLTLKPDALE